MTYNVFVGTLNLAQSVHQSIFCDGTQSDPSNFRPDPLIASEISGIQ